MLTRLHGWMLALSRGSACLGAALLIVGMLITVCDILLRQSLGTAITGTVDLTQFFVMAVVFLSIPYAFMTEGHVAVEMLTDPLPQRLQALLKSFGAALGLALTALLGWYGFGQAKLQAGYGDVSQTIGIPMLVFWVPLLCGFALSALATLLLCLGFLAEGLSGRKLLPGPPRPGADEDPG